jgi:hypothetical protein
LESLLTRKHMPTFKFESPEGKTYSVDGPEGATKEQAFQILQQQLGGAKPAAPPETLASDTLKSVGSGLEHGTATALGFPGDIRDLAKSVAPQGLIDVVKHTGIGKLLKQMPTSQDVLNSASDPMVDPNYEPQYAGNRYTQAIAKNAGPGLATGMGVGSTLLSAIAGQGAYDLTGSHLAEAAASLGGAIGPQVAMALKARKALQPLKDAAAVKAEANAGYADPLLKNTTVTPQATTGVAADMQSALDNAGSRFAPTQAPKITGAIENLGNPLPKTGIGPAAPVSIEDLHVLRKQLGKEGRVTQDFKPTEQAVAAGTAKKVLDDYLNNIPSKDVVGGNPIDAVQTLRTANANWGAASNANEVGRLINNAIISNSTVGSAKNLGNKLRQGFAPLLKNDAQKLGGQGDDIVDMVRGVTGGDTSTNLLREASNRLGGGGGIAGTMIGHGIANMAGGAALGPAGQGVASVLASIPGSLLRAAANRRTLKAAQGVQDAIIAKAPANAHIVAGNRLAKAANKAAIERAITKGGLPAAALLLSRLNGG